MLYGYPSLPVTKTSRHHYECLRLSAASSGKKFKTVKSSYLAIISLKNSKVLFINFWIYDF